MVIYIGGSWAASHGWAFCCRQCISEVAEGLPELMRGGCLTASDFPSLDYHPIHGLLGLQNRDQLHSEPPILHSLHFLPCSSNGPHPHPTPHLILVMPPTPHSPLLPTSLPTTSYPILIMPPYSPPLPTAFYHRGISMNPLNCYLPACFQGEVSRRQANNKYKQHNSRHPAGPGQQWWQLAHCLHTMPRLPPSCPHVLQIMPLPWLVRLLLHRGMALLTLCGFFSAGRRRVRTGQQQRAAPMQQRKKSLHAYTHSSWGLLEVWGPGQLPCLPCRCVCLCFLKGAKVDSYCSGSRKWCWTGVFTLCPDAEAPHTPFVTCCTWCAGVTVIVLKPPVPPNAPFSFSPSAVLYCSNATEQRMESKALQWWTRGGN